jgi:hypothetical protein
MRSGNVRALLLTRQAENRLWKRIAETCSMQRSDIRVDVVVSAAGALEEGAWPCPQNDRPCMSCASVVEYVPRTQMARGGSS